MLIFNVFVALFGLLGTGCRAARVPRVYYISNLLGAANSTGDSSSPWTLATVQVFLASNGAVPGDAFLFNADETFVVSSTILNITGVVGTSDLPVQFASYGINNSIASFVFSANTNVHAVIIVQSQFVVVSALAFDMDRFSSTGAALKLTCVFNVTLNSIAVTGQFAYAVSGKALGSGCGVDTLQVSGCSFVGMLNGGVIMFGNATVNTDPTLPDAYEHRNILIHDSYVADTGWLANASITTGTCVDVASVGSFYMWSNSFVRCGVNNGRPGIAPDFVRLTRVKGSAISWNLFHDSGSVPTGSVDGNNGIRVISACSEGQIDHNVFVSLAGSGVRFEAFGNGIEIDQWDRRFIDTWTIAFNIFENAGGYFGRPVVVFSASTSCSSLCFRNVRVIHNTIFVRPRQVPYPFAFAVMGPVNASSNFSLVNNVFYILNASSFVFFSSSLAPSSSLVLIGNVFATDALNAALLAVTSQRLYCYSIDQLHAAGFELFSGVPFGVMVSLNESLADRLGMLPEPSPDIDFVFGDPVSGGTVPLPNGDRINGVGFAVDILDVPLDPLFHAPGHERALLFGLADAYHPWPTSPAVGAGVALDPVFSAEVIASLGGNDVMGRFSSDVSRLSVDSGAVRYISSLTMIPGLDVSLVSGRWWLLDVAMTSNTDLTLSEGCNVTVEQGFDVPSNSELELLPGSNLTLLDGFVDVDADASISLEGNSSLNCYGVLTVEDYGTLSIQGGNCSVDVLILSPLASVDFLSSSRPIAIDEGVRFQGSLVVHLSSPPPKTVLRDVVVVVVATFPLGASNGTFSNVTVTPAFSSSCAYSGQLVASASTLGVLISTSSCQGTPIAVGAIVGAAVGCFVATCTIVGLSFWLLRRHNIAQVSRAFVKAQAERLQSNSEIQLMRSSFAEAKQTNVH